MVEPVYFTALFLVSLITLFCTFPTIITMLFFWYVLMFKIIFPFHVMVLIKGWSQIHNLDIFWRAFSRYSYRGTKISS